MPRSTRRPSSTDALDFGPESVLDTIDGVDSFAVVLTRRAVSPNGVARAGEIWRMCQEVAVQASVRAGWPPERFAEHRTGFIVSDMVVEHFREMAYGERATARTWMRDFRRGTLTHREVRLTGTHGPLARATQRWVHVRRGDHRSIQIERASDAILAAFSPVLTPAPAAEVPKPAVTTERGRSDRFELDVWETWMDTYGHVNHPMYVDFADEALARSAAAIGIDPQGILPIAERVRYRQAAVAGDRLSVETTAIGAIEEGDVVFEITVRRAIDQAVLVQITMVRGHREAPEEWRSWWMGPDGAGAR